MTTGNAPAPGALLVRTAAALRSAGRTTLLEDDGLDLAAALGLGTPTRAVVEGPDAVTDELLARFEGERVVVKVLSPGVAHRARRGGVRIEPRTAEAVVAAVTDLATRFEAADLRYLVEAWVPPREGATELLLALRWTRAWGPLVVVAPGGVDTEARVAELRDEAGPWMTDDATRGRTALEARGFLRSAVAALPDPAAAVEALAEIVSRLLAMGSDARAAGMLDLEFNPVRVGPEGWVALDALGRLDPDPGEWSAPSPGSAVDPGGLQDLLRARSMAIVGASTRSRNPGRIILRNVLEEGFDPGSIQVVKAGVEMLDGCRCVPDVESLEPVDLLVVAVAAAPAAQVVETALAAGLARAVILVPGGMEVGEEGERPLDRVVDALGTARRRREGGGPVIVGPNSLGIRSRPGRYDTLFLPRDRVRFPGGDAAPVALVSQSGAFALTRLAALPHLDPRYVVTLGNQADVTLGRMAEALLRDPEVLATAWYVEGFQPDDGRRWLDALSEMVGEGRPAVVYAAGRTEQGRDAASSHTASVAADPRVLRELCRRRGVAVVEGLQLFEDALALLAAWAHRAPPGPRLGVLSNAGFETVAMADGARGLAIPALAEPTRRRIRAVLDGAGLADLVPLVHPLDVTPMLGDADFAAVAEAIVGDPGIDVGVVGCVPLTPALDTPLEGRGAGPDAAAEGQEDGPGRGGDGGGDVAGRLIELWRRTRRPWLVVLDAGPGHEWMRARLRAGGVPVLGGMDRVGPALRAVLGGD